MKNEGEISAFSKEAGIYRVSLHDSLQDPEVRRAWLHFEQSSPLTAFQRLSFVENLFSHLASEQEASPVIAAVREKGGGIVMLMAFARRKHLGLTLVEHVDFNVSDYAVPLTAPGHVFNASEMADIRFEIIEAMKPADAVIIKKICPVIHDHDNPFAQLPDLHPMNATCTSVRLSTPGRHTDQPLRRSVAVRDAEKKLRRLSKIGPVEFVQATTNAELSVALDTMVAQRTCRFAELHRPDILRDPHVVDFYRSLAQRGLHDESVRVFSLNVGMQTLSVVYALEHRNTLSVLIPSMINDGQWKPYSPGLIALVKTVEWANLRGMSHCDLGVGGLAYKSRFKAKEQQLYEVFWPLTLRGRLAASQAHLKRSYRGFGRRFPAIDAHIRRTLGK